MKKQVDLLGYEIRIVLVCVSKAIASIAVTSSKTKFLLQL